MKTPRLLKRIVGNPSGAETSGFRLDSDTVVDGGGYPLGTTEVALGRLYGDVAKKKLDLFQFAAGRAAESSATSSEIMRCEFANANFGGELLHDMPDQLFRHAFAPYFTGAAYPPEKAASVNPGGIRPVVQQLVNPIRNRNRSNVPSLSPQVYYCPMPVPLLEMRQSQFRHFDDLAAIGRLENAIVAG